HRCPPESRRRRAAALGGTHRTGVGAGRTGRGGWAAIAWRVARLTPPPRSSAVDVRWSAAGFTLLDPARRRPAPCSIRRLVWRFRGLRTDWGRNPVIFAVNGTQSARGRPPGDRTPQ